MTIILLLAAAMALIWGYVFVRQFGVIGGCLATLTAGSCFGYPFFHISVITLDRVMFGGVVVLFLLQWLHGNVRKLPLSKSDVLLAVFMLVLLYSTMTHNWKLSGAQPLATLLFFYAMPFGLYWIASRTKITEGSFRALLWIFAFFGLYLSLTAVCEVANVGGLVFPRYIMSPQHAEFLGRGRGPFLNPVGNGMYLIAAFIASMILWNYVHRLHRPIVVLLCFACFAGAILTLTRSVWLGAGCALVGMCAMIAPKQHRVRVVFAFGLLGMVLFAAKGSSMSKFKRDKEVSAEVMAESAKLRPILAAYAYEIFCDYPFTGVGFGQYGERNIEYLTRRSFDLPMEKAKMYVQHNIFLSLLAETGLMGLVAFVFVLLHWILDGWAVWHASQRPLWQRQCGLFSLLLLAAYLPNGMFHELSLIPMLNMLVFFFAGLSRGQLQSENSNLNRRDSDQRRNSREVVPPVQLEDRRRPVMT